MKKKFYSMLIVAAMILSNLTPTFAETQSIAEETLLIGDVEVGEAVETEEALEVEELSEDYETEDTAESNSLTEKGDAVALDDLKDMDILPMSLVEPSNTSETYVPFVAPREDGYFSFYEDFTQLETKPDSLSGFTANAVIAKRPDGVAWKGAKWTEGKAMIGEDGLTLRGNNTPGNPPIVKVDMSGALGNVEDNEIPQEKQKITFEINGGDIGCGPLFFINESKTSFIWMGTYGGNGVNYFFDQVSASKRPGSAFVAFFKGGKVKNEDFIYTTVDLSAGSRWEVSVDEDILSWKVYNTQGTEVWDGEATLDERFKTGSFVNLFGFGSGGKSKDGILKNISYKTGEFYTKEMGEPTSTLYMNVMDRAKLRNDISEEDDVYELTEAADIKRIEFEGYTGNSFALGYDEGGSIVWDTFTKNDGNEYGEWIVLGESDGLNRWLNTYTTKKYKYIKAPTGNTGSGELKAFENISDGATVRLNSNDRPDAPATRYLYISDGDGWKVNTSFTAESENNNYITVDGNGSSDGKLAITGVKGTYRLDEANESLAVTIDANGAAAGGAQYEITVVVEGPLTDMQNGLITESEYVATQQPVIDALNNAIATGNTANIENFFNPAVGYESKNVSELDLIDASVFSGADTNFANRIKSYGATLSAGTTLEELENLCDILTMESYVGKLDGLADKAIAGTEQKKNEDGSGMFDGDGNPVYYTEDEADLLTKDRLEECIDLLNLPLNNKYYVSENGSDSSFAADIRSRVAQITNFENVNDLIETINETVLMTVFENNDNASYMVKLFQDYADTMVLSTADEEKLDEIVSNVDKSNKFSKAIKDAAKAAPASYDTPAELKNFITNYTIPAEPTKTPSSGSSSSSGGGSGLSGVVTLPSTNKQPDNTVAEKTQIFGDVPIDFWGYEAIRYMHAKKAVQGYPDGSFGPDNALTKAELIQMIMGLFNPEVEIPEDYINPFGDVSEDAWYYNSVIKANVYGVFMGGGNIANPNEYVNRQEMATMIYRAIEKSGRTLSRDVEIQKFGDEEMIADWAYTPIAKMQAAGIVAGSDGNFNPTGNSTRAMAAQMLYKAMQGFESPVVSEEEAK